MSQARSSLEESCFLDNNTQSYGILSQSKIQAITADPVSTQSNLMERRSKSMDSGRARGLRVSVREGRGVR